MRRCGAAGRRGRSGRWPARGRGSRRGARAKRPERPNQRTRGAAVDPGHDQLAVQGLGGLLGVGEGDLGARRRRSAPSRRPRCGRIASPGPASHSRRAAIRGPASVSLVVDPSSTPDRPRCRPGKIAGRPGLVADRPASPSPGRVRGPARSRSSTESRAGRPGRGGLAELRALAVEQPERLDRRQLDEPQHRPRPGRSRPTRSCTRCGPAARAAGPSRGPRARRTVRRGSPGGVPPVGISSGPTRVDSCGAPCGGCPRSRCRGRGGGPRASSRGYGPSIGQV